MLQVRQMQKWTYGDNGKVKMSRIAGGVDPPERPVRRSRGRAVDTDDHQWVVFAVV